MIVIEPRPGRPFPLDVVAGAGEEHPAVGLSTGIHACGRGICMIRNCRYDIDFCLDRGVIVSNPVEVYSALTWLVFCSSIQWELLQERFFIPRTTDTVKTSPRNRILLCKNHRALFDSEYFFIRYHQEVCPSHLNRIDLCRLKNTTLSIAVANRVWTVSTAFLVSSIPTQNTPHIRTCY